MKVMLCLLTLGLLGSALAATRLVQWKPGLCSDNPDLDGTGIPVVWPGVTRFCSLQVNFVPFQSYIVRADFKYELIYYETINGKSSEKKIVLPGVDTFLFDGTSNDGVDLYQSDEIQTNSLVRTAWFQLPLAVNARSKVSYSFVGATGTLVFSDGTRKNVYQRLPVFYGD